MIPKIILVVLVIIMAIVLVYDLTTVGHDAEHDDDMTEEDWKEM